MFLQLLLMAFIALWNERVSKYKVALTHRGFERVRTYAKWARVKCLYDGLLVQTEGK